ncbi:fumarylacetoacetate hydrolase family protein [Paenactinomyces guangxiensis]|uniref:Fumarylacetoacetate hydrolase family protein n=1 Tax=Paenactinomyces guangxiensis TaxID=1490290 RepID=A0A7W1WP64_9BACL|nr:fumarylacetoacetate hydrolase family protein [Paenactinomyces guangxiensis]MBA4493497.1 fumarylacetoacetate hydrolase family protein [Paenactinomyces guangxiensis]MBH8590588.1 fumarylacetoacetate hydrolase family protein [Paenactinomyces guangxiensis]
MRIIRFLNENLVPTLAALTDDEKVYVLPHRDFIELVQVAEEQGSTPLSLIEGIMATSNPLDGAASDLNLIVPIEAPEVWACGVTYERSRDARNYEATGGKLDQSTFYDKVYDAERPEVFFKSTAARTVGPNQNVYLRSDSTWQIPEPELGLVISKSGKIVGYTIGNDMSCRDIEGENPLYLPQAKIWRYSCSIGPAIRLAETVEDPYNFDITCRIYRDEKLVVEGSANTGQLKRKFDELITYLVRDNEVFDGTVLLTGTCIVPPNEFTLEDGDRIEIEISRIGVLNNPVKSQVGKSVGAQ